jgi:hypothetical protein
MCKKGCWSQYTSSRVCLRLSSRFRASTDLAAESGRGKESEVAGRGPQVGKKEGQIEPSSDNLLAQNVRGMMDCLKKGTCGASGVAEVVECLSSKHEAVS